jgi:DNA polymerase I
VNIDPNQSDTSTQNFLLQSNGADMLRLAAILATGQGVGVCGAVHDALMIEARLDELDDAIATTRAAMARASAKVLSGYELRTGVEIVRAPDRYMEARGEPLWSTVMEFLDRQAAESDTGIRVPFDQNPCGFCQNPCTHAVSFGVSLSLFSREEATPADARPEGQ